MFNEIHPLRKAAFRRTTKALGRLLSANTATGLTKAGARRLWGIRLRMAQDTYYTEGERQAAVALVALTAERWAKGERRHIGR